MINKDEYLEKEMKLKSEEIIALLCRFLNKAEIAYEKSNECNTENLWSIFKIKPKHNKEFVINILINDGAYTRFELEKVEESDLKDGK